MGISDIFGGILSAMQLIFDDKRFEKEQRQLARIALSAAFNATEGYYAALSSGAEKDAAREHEIAHLWDQVAIRIEPVSESIANRIGLKSRYWREGAAWSDKEIAAAKIQLDYVRRDANYALIRQ